MTKATVYIATSMLVLIHVHGAMAQAAPPPGIRYDQHVSVAGNPPPGATLHNPFKGDTAVATQGSTLFTGFNCDGCHFGGSGPSLTDGRWRYGGEDGEIFMSIYYGRARGMPAFGGTLPPETIWRLVTYVQSFHPADSTVATTRW